MQVARELPARGGYSGERVSKTGVTGPREGDNPPKGELIPRTPMPLRRDRESCRRGGGALGGAPGLSASWQGNGLPRRGRVAGLRGRSATLALRHRSEEHTSELQSRQYLVCRLLLEKKKNKNSIYSFS